MALAPEKRKFLEQVGLPSEAIDSLEANIAGKAQGAQAAGIESKTKDADPPATPPVDTPAPPVPQADPVYVTETAFASALADVVKPMADILADIRNRLGTVEGEVKALKATDEEKVAAKSAATPRASLQELIAQSIIGNDEARIDGRSALAKAGPKAPDKPARQITGVPFLDGLIQQNLEAVQ